MECIQFLLNKIPNIGIIKIQSAHIHDKKLVKQDVERSYPGMTAIEYAGNQAMSVEMINLLLSTLMKLSRNTITAQMVHNLIVAGCNGKLNHTHISRDWKRID